MGAEQLLRKLTVLADKLTRAVIVLFTSGMVFFICLQIYCRFVLNNALSWPEELAVFLMIWFSLLAAVYVQKEKAHIRMVFFYNKCSPLVQALINVFNNALILIFLLFVVYQGIIECLSMIPLETSALRISRAIPYLALPVTGMMFIFVGIIQIIEDSIRLKNLWRF